MSPQFGINWGIILIDLVYSNTYVVQITYVNPWFSGILIEEQNIDTNEQEGTRKVPERWKQGMRTA